MLARYLNAPLLLLAWQVAPIRFSASAGEGRYLYRDNPGYPAGVDCGGNSYPAEPPSSSADTYKSVAVSAEVRASNVLAFRVATGNIEDASGERSGRFGAGQVVYQRERFAVGLGLASFGGMERSVEPSVSLRVGKLDGITVHADYHAASAGMGMIGGPRFGVGWNQGAERKLHILLGVATTPVPDSARRAGGFLELGLPLKWFDGRTGLSATGFLSGTRAGFETKRIFGAAVGAWVDLGKKVSP